MKVKELIEKLSQEDPEMRVVVTGYECGYDELEELTKVGIAKNAKKEDKWWEGEFHETPKIEPFETALLLPRKS
jgi:hypothetical protein